MLVAKACKCALLQMDALKTTGWNPALAELTGKAPADLNGSRIPEMPHSSVSSALEVAVLLDSVPAYVFPCFWGKLNVVHNFCMWPRPLRRCSFMKSHPGCFLQVSEWSLRLCLGGRALRHEVTRAGLESARSSLAKHFTGVNAKWACWVGSCVTSHSSNVCLGWSPPPPPGWVNPDLPELLGFVEKWGVISWAEHSMNRAGLPLQVPSACYLTAYLLFFFFFPRAFNFWREGICPGE